MVVKELIAYTFIGVAVYWGLESSVLETLIYLILVLIYWELCEINKKLIKKKEAGK